MFIAEWVIGQLLSYSPWTWLYFFVVAIVTAYCLRIPGILLSQIVVAISIFVLDLYWIQTEMRRPDWDGQPDRDVIFFIGVLVRVLLFNTLLLPVGVIAWWWSRSRTTVRESGHDSRG